jgi:hypothetical protein
MGWSGDASPTRLLHPRHMRGGATPLLSLPGSHIQLPHIRTKGTAAGVSLGDTPDDAEQQPLLLLPPTPSAASHISSSEGDGEGSTAWTVGAEGEGAGTAPPHSPSAATTSAARGATQATGPGGQNILQQQQQGQRQRPRLVPYPHNQHHQQQQQHQVEPASPLGGASVSSCVSGGSSGLDLSRLHADREKWLVSADDLKLSLFCPCMWAAQHALTRAVAVLCGTLALSHTCMIARTNASSVC